MTLLHTLPKLSPKAAMDALAATRDAVREQAHQFSAETWRFWRDLECEMDIKLQDAEHRLAQGGALVAETVVARVGELRRALDTLIEEHSHPQVHSIMTAEVKTCRPEDSLAEAARTLWDYDCGAVPVVDAEHKVLGMLTDRDICMAGYTRNAAISACTVASAMSHGAFSCSGHDSIQDLAELMRQHQIRRVPVTEPNGTLIGIVTLADVARYLNSLPDEHPARGLLVPALAGISARRSGTAVCTSPSPWKPF